MYLTWQNINSSASNKVCISALLQHKENFKEMDAQESQRLVRGQKDRLDYEVRKFRRRRLVQYHDLEQDLLREVRLRAEVVSRGTLVTLSIFRNSTKDSCSLRAHTTCC